MHFSHTHLVSATFNVILKYLKCYKHYPDTEHDSIFFSYEKLFIYLQRFILLLITWNTLSYCPLFLDGDQGLHIVEKRLHNEYYMKRMMGISTIPKL